MALKNKKKNLKLERDTLSADSTYQRATAKRKAGSQNSGEEIMKKLGISNSKTSAEDEANDTSADKSVDAIVDYLTNDYMKRKKIHNK